MANTASGLVVPAGSDLFDPQGDMVDLANSFRSRIVVPVSNDTGRAALLAAIDWTPTPGEPLRVTRADTGAHEHYDGTAWRTTWLPDAVATFAVGGLWSVSGTPSIYRRGIDWWASITLTQKNAGAISAGWTSMGTVSTDARVTGGGIVYGSAKVSAPEGPAFASIDRGSGAVQVHMPSFTGTTGTTFLIALKWPAV